MNNYTEVYFSRIKHLGTRVGERIVNAGEREFEKWLNKSPHTVWNLTTEQDLMFSGIILENKQDENRKTKLLHVNNKTDLHVGDIVNWQERDLEEKWIVYMKERKTNESYQTFYIIRCNYLLKWVDSTGFLRQSWAYFVSSMDSKIKENYRTWHNLITPQQNKYAEFILPFNDIPRHTNFIVEDEAWNVVETDFSSVPGIIYIALVEQKVNAIYDDLNEDIADTDKLVHYDILVPQTTQTFSLGQTITPIFTIIENGIPVEKEVVYSTDNYDVIDFYNGQPRAKGHGTANLILSLKGHEEVKLNIPIEVSVYFGTLDAYISGPDKIRMDRSETYELMIDESPLQSVQFSISDTSLATVKRTGFTTCTIHANDMNKLGTITLTAIYRENTYTKVINIVPLW